MDRTNGPAVIAVAAILSAAWAPEAVPPVSASEPKDVSLVQLIANSAEWHGKLVRVDGYCRLEFEETVLYLHEEDSEHLITRNGVWLRLGWPIPEKYRDVGDGYVLVEGVFDADQAGHMGMFSGEIKDVRRIQRLRSRKELARPPR